MATRADLRTRLASAASRTGRPIILDGATGTELMRRGVPTHLPLWSTAGLLSRPDVVEQIHRDYVEAGAEIIVANTFRTNTRTLRAAGLLARGGALNRLAVELARQATRAARIAAAQCWVAASIAPVEDCYQPGRVPPDAELADEHARMSAWLADAAPDLVWIETMNTVREARIAAEAVRAAGLPFVVSWVVREDGALLSGEPLADAVAAVEPLGPLALGLNCIPPAGMTRNLPRLRAQTERALIAYAHIGNPAPISGWSFSEVVAPEDYAREAARWVRLGAAVIGGCCGTTPRHIAALACGLRVEP